MRKVKVYLRFFWPLLMLALISFGCIFLLPEDMGNFTVGLISTTLGVGISIAAAEGIKKLTEYRRMKKTAGLLKLVVIQYLKNQCLNLKENSKLYKDMGNFEHALAFMLLIQNYDKISATFDKDWFQLVYSAEFIDVIRTDDQLNTIGHAISEVLLFNKGITFHALSASRLISRWARLSAAGEFSQDDADHFVIQARKIRDNIDDSLDKLEKYTHELDRELNLIFSKTGATYSEIER